jgi:para-aminobenzoate synthetase/4-amino-4-deoxychorismate lyase
VISANRPAEIPALFAEIESAVAAGHFAAGFFAYEAGACFEPTAELLPSRPGLPLAWFGIYENCHRFDHQTGAFAEGDPPGLSRFAAEIRDDQPSQEAQPEAIFSLSEQEYSQRVAAIHAWIRAGDVYQLNFTAPFEVQASGSPAALYARLRSRQPVEFGAFLHGNPEHRILSFSPELFFRLEGRGAQRRIRTRPMKGTAPRGRTTREDRQQAEWLRHDPKNRSENVMIVDLLRNDLGRLCAFGSVRVESLFAVERYSTLWQMTSTVAGELRPEVRFEEIFRALFPCGSITGAPKVRAMQLLSRIEQQPRGIYTGAIGFFSREQTVFNVAIRTLELEEPCGQSDRQRGVMGVGGGIVADSEAGEEFRECRLKAEFLTGASDVLSQKFSLVETMLWREGYPLIELHLDRLEDSAEYFAFACDRTEIKAALLSHASSFADPAPRKVRLLLDGDGEGGLRIESEVLSVNAVARPERACMARERTDPRDRMLFHKTTHRPVYAAAFQAAIRAGLDDVLFFNLRDELTEGAISNVFVEKGGRWFTPPVECGLLAGVFRRHLLESQPNVEECVLYLEDLRQADAIYLANAVRGLRRVVLDWEA